LLHIALVELAGLKRADVQDAVHTLLGRQWDADERSQLLLAQD
jgi:hypothetical protein